MDMNLPPLICVDMNDFLLRVIIKRAKIFITSVPKRLP